MQAAPSTVTFLRNGGEVMPMNEILVIISLATAVVSFMAADVAYRASIINLIRVVRGKH